MAGKTGENLSILIRYLKDNENTKHYFTSSNKYDYRITNAYTEVLYKQKNGRTEPKMSEIKSSENVTRLKSELKDFSIIILCGKKAQKAYECLGIEKKIKVINIKHLGMQGLNHVPIDESVPQKKRTDERLKMIARHIAEEISSWDVMENKDGE